MGVCTYIMLDEISSVLTSIQRKFRRVQMFDSDDEGETDDIRGGRGDEELPTPVEDIFGGSDDEDNEMTEGRRSHLAKPFDSGEEEVHIWHIMCFSWFERKDLSIKICEVHIVLICLLYLLLQLLCQYFRC